MKRPASCKVSLSFQSGNNKQAPHVTVAIYVGMNFQKIYKEGGQQLRTPH